MSKITQTQAVEIALTALAAGKVETPSTLDRVAACAATLSEAFTDAGKAIAKLTEMAKAQSVELDPSKLETVQVLMLPEAAKIVTEAKRIAKADNRRINSRILVNDIGGFVIDGVPFEKAVANTEAKREGKSDLAAATSDVVSKVKAMDKSMKAQYAELAKAGVAKAALRDAHTAMTTALGLLEDSKRELAELAKNHDAK